MKVLDRRAVRVVAGLAGVSALLFALYSLWKRGTPPPPQQQPEKQEESQSDEEHIPFEQLMEDRHGQWMGRGRVGEARELRDISYRVILCVMKGCSYQGIVNVSFQLGKLRDGPFALNFRGSGVKFLMVNGTRVDKRDVSFVDHLIGIPRELLREGGRNSIEVIFQNGYSFLNEGICAYFTLDDNQKYSLRQQVVYTHSGYLEIERMLPCLNCLNPCSVKVEVIHPDTFEVFSNANKSLERFCSVTEYHKYPFLFDLASNSLSRSFRLNASLSLDTSSQYSSSNFYNRKKANTHFYPTVLPSIHHLFVFSSAMTELLPDPYPHPLQDTLMLRYFCKHAESHRFAKTINKLHVFILEALKKLLGRSQNPLGKLDVLIVADRETEGYFAPGAIMVSEQSLSETLSMRCLYLVGRAVAGVWQLSVGQNVVTLDQVMALNELVFSKFQEFRNYLCLMNLKHERIRTFLTSRAHKDFLQKQEGFFLKYYAKELKFIILRSTPSVPTSEFAPLLLFLKQGARNDFWESLLASHNFFPQLLLEPLTKVALQRLGVPSEDRLREQLKIVFSGSKHVLSFYSDQEISDNLPKFIECEAVGLERRLPGLKVKQKFKDFITEKYDKFLPVKSNLAEAEAIYNQFKKFNQAKNFHPHTLLKQEVERVAAFGKGFLKPQRVSAHCTVSGWKLLKHIQLYPADEHYYSFLKAVDDIEQL